MIVAGYSSYPRHFDYGKMREIADSVGAVLLADIAHISGLVATGNAPDVFKHCHIVTTTTHKTLRGPRGALVFALNKHGDKNLMEAIHQSTFPGFQGGPHNHTIGAIATALKEANSPAFKTYADMVVRNARQFAVSLQSLGYELFTHGTDNHIVLMNLRNKQIDGGRVEHLCNYLGISINKNTLKGDVSAVRPSGIRLGTPAMTTRGATEADFDKIAGFLHQAICYAVKANTFKKVSEYNEFITKMAKEDSELLRLKAEVEEFAGKLSYNNLSLE